MAKTKYINESKILKEAETMTITELAKKYGVCYQSMHSYLNSLEGSKGHKVGRPRSIIFKKTSPNDKSVGFKTM